ncbi:hypothetical protein SBADM41S_09277 [Streptomyces badius]
MCQAVPSLDVGRPVEHRSRARKSVRVEVGEGIAGGRDAADTHAPRTHRGRRRGCGGHRRDRVRGFLRRRARARGGEGLRFVLPGLPDRHRRGHLRPARPGPPADLDADPVPDPPPGGVAADRGDDPVRQGARGARKLPGGRAAWPGSPRRRRRAPPCTSATLRPSESRSSYSRWISWSKASPARSVGLAARVHPAQQRRFHDLQHIGQGGHPTLACWTSRPMPATPSKAYIGPAGWTPSKTCAVTIWPPTLEGGAGRGVVAGRWPRRPRPRRPQLRSASRPSRPACRG